MEMVLEPDRGQMVVDLDVELQKLIIDIQDWFIPEMNSLNDDYNGFIHTGNGSGNAFGIGDGDGRGYGDSGTFKIKYGNGSSLATANGHGNGIGRKYRSDNEGMY
jgi:hypothetical protein